MSTSRQRAQGHARRAHYCSCGAVIHGNGARAAHAKAHAARDDGHTWWTTTQWHAAGSPFTNHPKRELRRPIVPPPEPDGVKTTWKIHTGGGPIRRIFTTLDNALRWARERWPDAVIEHVVGEGTYVLSAKRDRRPFASIAQRRHCPTCDHVDATRSDVLGSWHPAPSLEDHLVPRDFDGDARDPGDA